MAEITEYTYMQIRDMLESKIKYIELRDDTGAKIIRIPITENRQKRSNHHHETNNIIIIP